MTATNPSPARADAPAFELESYDDETLPHNKRLESFEDLVGHTITHVFDDCWEQEGNGETVLVTETGCWIVLEAEGDGDTRAEIKVATDKEYSWQRSQRGRAALLSDYVQPGDLFHARLCTSGELELLKQQQAKKTAVERAKQAEVLRKQLAALEGGAS